MNKKAQVWVETVIYTLIGLALIGIVLTIVMPKISQARDRIVIEQTIDSLNKFDGKIMEAWDWGDGNTRTIDFTMRKGELFINADSDEIVFIIGGLNKPYSEPGVEIEQGRIKILSEEGQKTSSVQLVLDYGEIADLKYNGGDIQKKFDATSVAYSFFIDNFGREEGGLFVLDISEGSD
ncbi:MAG: hypothetical protein ABIG28_03295 [archaeon]